MLQAVLDPAHGDAELARREAHQDDVREDRGLDPERAARVGRRDQAQLRAGEAERAGRDRVQRERALEVRPRGERALGGVPVRDDAVALDRRAAPAREAEALAHDEVGFRERGVDVAVVERAVGDACVGLDRGLRVEHGLERLVLDLDQLEGVLGEVAVARDDDRDGLADVARRSRARRRSAGPASRCPPGTDARAPRRPHPSGRRRRPESSSAAVASSRVMRACANGERSTAACRALATGSRSSMKRPSPRSSASSSRRGSGRPTHGSEAALAPTRYYLTIALWPGFATISASCSRAFAPGRRARTTRSSDSPSCRIATSGSRGSTSIASFARALRRPCSRRARRRSRSREIFAALLEGGAGSVLATRADDAARAAVARGRARGRGGRARALHLGRARRPRAARARRRWSPPARPTARSLREARIRAELLGTTVVVHEDVGVAGVHRLATALPDLERADCVVVVAGMDGALASLVGGLARGPGDRRADERRLRLGARRDDGAERDARLVRGRARGRRDRRRARRRDDRGADRARSRLSRVAYLDCVGGLAGDMLLAALLDAGAELETLRRVPAALGLEGVEIEVERVERQGIGALHLAHRRAATTTRIATTREIRELVEAADLPERARTRSLEAFARLAEVEGGIHGVPPDDVHFHELGSLDTLVDVCGAFVLLDELGVERVVSSPLPFARGFVTAAHGVLPLPAPATLGLLEGAPLVGVDTEAELVTPTGAAIAATVVEEWGALPPLTLEARRLRRGHEGLRRPAERRARRARRRGRATDGPGRPPRDEPRRLPARARPGRGRALLRGRRARRLDRAGADEEGPPGLRALRARAARGAEARSRASLLEETSALGVRVSRLDRYELEREERVVEVGGRDASA